MRLALLAFAALLLAAPAAAQRQPEWRTATEVDILLHPFRYEPRTIRLRAGQPVLLHFVNDGFANLSFRAPRFFAASLERRLPPAPRRAAQHRPDACAGTLARAQRLSASPTARHDRADHRRVALLKAKPCITNIIHEENRAWRR